MKRKWLSVQNSADNKTATIDIEGTIGGNFWDGTGTTKEDVKAELKQIAALKPETIIVNIDSLGGSVAHAMSIHDLLASNKAKKEVRINGATASSATVIAMAGDEIKMSDNALFLPHLPMNLIIGNRIEVQAGLDELKTFEDKIVNIYAKRIGKSVEEITKQLEVNNGVGEWMTADEAKAFGFVTDIFEPSKIASIASPEIIAQHKLPLIPTNKIKSQTKMEITLDGITASIKNAIAEAFKGKKDETKPTDEQINKVAAEQAELLKKDYDAKIVTASATVKAEAESAHKVSMDAKEVELTAAKADVTRLTTELAAATAGETVISKVGDPPIDGKKPEVSENVKALQEVLKNVPVSEKMLHAPKAVK